MKKKKKVWKEFKYEWCKLGLLNDKLNLCFETKFSLTDIGVLFVALQFNRGIAIGLLGITISFSWCDGSIL